MKQSRISTRFAKALPALILSLLLIGGVVLADGEDEKYEQEAGEYFQQAQQALDRNNYKEAAAQYNKVLEDYDKSSRVTDALYWRAFALYRLGDAGDLNEASRLLIRLMDDHSQSSSFADAEELYIRILGERGGSGDVQALEALTRSVYLINDDLTPGIRVVGDDRPYRIVGDDLDGILTDTRWLEMKTELLDMSQDELNRVRFELQSTADRVLPHVLISSHDDDDDLRLTALNALIQMDSDRALPIVRGVLEKRDEGSVELRRRALFILAQSDSDEAADILLDVVREDPDAEVRAKAVYWLGQVPGERSLAAIRLVLDKDDDHEVQNKALYALSRHDSPKAMKMLRDLAADGSRRADLREKAIFWLRHDGGDEGIEFLKRLYGDLPNRKLKEAIIESVARQESRESQKWLLKLVRDDKEDTETRARALFWAGRMDRIPAGDLKNLYQKLDSHEIKEQLIFVLSHQDDQASRDQLVKIAHEEKSVELRKRAIFWLGQTDDPRVFDILEEIINEK